MKGFKFVAVCYCLITIALICLIAVMAFGIIPVRDSQYCIEQVSGSGILQAVFLIIAAVLFIMGIITMFGGSGTNNQHETQNIKELTFGTISITILAIEEIAKRYFDEIKDVRTVNLSTAKTKTGIDITARLTLAPQIVIPEITEKVQAGLKECLENFTGITVENVHVIVCDSTSAK